MVQCRILFKVIVLLPLLAFSLHAGEAKPKPQPKQPEGSGPVAPTVQNSPMAEVVEIDKAETTPVPVSSRDDVPVLIPVDDKTKPKAPTDPKPDANVTLQDEKGIYLSVEEAIEIAIQNNLNLRLSRLDDRAADIDVRTAWAQYYPEFTAGVRHFNTRQTGQESGDGSFAVSGGVRQRTPWGSVLDFSVSETRSRFNTETANGGFNINVAQPLWRGAGFDVGLAGIRQARINRLISRGNLDLDTQQLIFNVRQAYANIIGQIQGREVNKQAVRSAQTFMDLTSAREAVGQVTKLDIFNAEVQLRRRELDLLSIERQLEQAYDNLKQAMDVDLEETIRVNAPTVDFGEKREANENKELRTDKESGTVMLVVSREGKVADTTLLFQATRFDYDVILREAITNRIDLLNGYRALAVQKIQAMLARDGLGLDIDLSGGYGRNFTGRATFESDNGNEVNAWNVGLNAAIPWGKIRDRAAYENALLALQRAEINLKQSRTTIHASVRDTLRRLVEAERAILIQAEAVEQAKRSVEAAQISFDRGLKDSFDVIRAEDDLLRAKTDFIRTRLDYTVRLADLERVVGKPTGRVDLSGGSVGGLIDSRLPDSMRDRPLPRPQPEPEERPEANPLNKSREYRKDYWPKRDSPVLAEPESEARPIKPEERPK